MADIKVNSDLLKCENDFFTKDSKTKSLLITKNAKKNAISAQLSQTPLKTEKICSSVLSRAKQFLDITKTDDNIAEKCDLVDENDFENNESKQMIEMNLMLFENKKQSNSESSDEESESTESSDSSSEDSEEDSSDSKQHSDKDTDHEKKDLITI